MKRKGRGEIFKRKGVEKREKHREITTFKSAPKPTEREKTKPKNHNKQTYTYITVITSLESTWHMMTQETFSGLFCSTVTCMITWSLVASTRTLTTTASMFQTKLFLHKQFRLDKR